MVVATSAAGASLKGAGLLRRLPRTQELYAIYMNTYIYLLHLFVDIFKNFIKNIFRFTHLLWYHQIGIFLLLLANTIQSAARRA